MANPIQAVLDAEVEAQRQIDHEAQLALKRVHHAQRQARQIVNRNEKRTGKVVKRYEALCQRDLTEKIDAMVDAAKKDLHQFIHLSGADRKRIVEAVFVSLSPPFSGKEKTDG